MSSYVEAIGVLINDRRSQWRTIDCLRLVWMLLLLIDCDERIVR